ncbi:hypothetical protein HO173_002332 [Letharia columbiana]|uniref:Uncharacterized protein n=1 Tax=Letharia columbiana TaxID=112416 RepID=A0A8H6G3D9_9LECA|nr:uncharacterized protein HO173_002332 [Letharia columbiana]KAF6239786.1 hypothetical protein HO173_002332 [Letharia columbiana]
MLTDRKPNPLVVIGAEDENETGSYQELSMIQSNQSTKTPLPYREYVHDLVQGGWDILKPLDEYMSVDIEDQELVVPILEITDTSRLERRPDIHDGLALKKFWDEGKPANVKVRTYMAEPGGDLAAGVMAALGSSLDLDPRLFQSGLRGHKRVLAPSDHHRAPFTSIKFGVPKLSTPLMTDAEKFKVTFLCQA